MRPWKEEQLGGGYAVSSFCERTALEAADAIVAVSSEMRARRARLLPGDRPRARARDLQRHRHRGVPRPTPAPTCSSATASTPRGRRSSSSAGSRARRASRTCATPRSQIDPAAQLVLCAGAPDTPEIGAEIAAKVERVRAERGNVVWLEQMLPKPEVIQLSRTRPSSSARRSTSRSASSTSRRWRARPPSSPRARAGSPRSSTTASPGCSSPSSRATTAPASRSTRSGSPRDIAERVNELVARSGARCGDGPGGPPPRGRALLLARDRRADGRAVPLAALDQFRRGLLGVDGGRPLDRVRHLRCDPDAYGNSCARRGRLARDSARRSSATRSVRE